MRRCVTLLTGLVIVLTTVASTAAVGATQQDDTASRPTDLTDGIRGRSVSERPLLAPDVCLPDLSPASLDTLFYSYPAGIVGADYARTLRVPSGDVLWTFQDAKVLLPGDEVAVLHNIGMVQRGNCFTVLRSGTDGAPRPWLFAEDTIDRQRWFWPLDAELGSDGKVYVYLADTRELPPPPPPDPEADGPDPDAPEPDPPRDYLFHTVPHGTFVAQIDPDTWTVEFYGVPTDASADLYGFSIESDSRWTYFFAQCHRQFGFDPYVFGVLAHDRSCSDRVTVARVPRGQLFDPPSYWDGHGWTSDSSRAAPIIEQTGRFANPTQFLFSNNHWVAVTKIDDWWGDTVVVERARRPTGPFDHVAAFRPQAVCGECNTYFASWVIAPSQPEQESKRVDPTTPLTISLSNNRWDGQASAFYRPTFFTVPAPPDLPASADRCALGHCD